MISKDFFLSMRKSYVLASVHCSKLFSQHPSSHSEFQTTRVVSVLQTSYHFSVSNHSFAKCIFFLFKAKVRCPHLHSLHQSPQLGWLLPLLLISAVFCLPPYRSVFLPPSPFILRGDANAWVVQGAMHWWTQWCSCMELIHVFCACHIVIHKETVFLISSAWRWRCENSPVSFIGVAQWSEWLI